MKNNIKTVCIFASASNNIDEEYFNAAKSLGNLLGKNEYNIVYGGSNLGLMGAVCSSALEAGSHITGVMPEKLYSLGIKEGPCNKFIVTKGMRDRKAKMDELSDGIIALPGGFGTIEELSEMIVQKQLGYNSKPIVILNTKGYYNNLAKFFDDIYTQNFAQINSKEIYHIANTPSDALEYIKNYHPKITDYIKDKIKINL